MSAFSTVPRPIRSFSGIQSASTSRPSRLMITPTGRPVRFESPPCSTSHGALPRWALKKSAMPTPKQQSPAMHGGTRRASSFVGIG